MFSHFFFCSMPLFALQVYQAFSSLLIVFSSFYFFIIPACLTKCWWYVATISFDHDKIFWQFFVTVVAFHCKLIDIQKFFSMRLSVLCCEASSGQSQNFHWIFYGNGLKIGIICSYEIRRNWNCFFFFCRSRFLKHFVVLCIRFLITLLCAVWHSSTAIGDRLSWLCMFLHFCLFIVVCI